MTSLRGHRARRQREGALRGDGLQGPHGVRSHADIATAGILRLAENLPLVVEIVDSEERLEYFLPFLRRAVKTGIVLSSQVEAEQVVPEGSQVR